MFHANINEIIFFSCFLLFIFLMLGSTLEFSTNTAMKQTFTEALIWTMVWVTISMIFYFLIRNLRQPHPRNGYT